MRSTALSSLPGPRPSLPCSNHCKSRPKPCVKPLGHSWRFSGRNHPRRILGQGSGQKRCCGKRPQRCGAMDGAKVAQAAASTDRPPQVLALSVPPDVALPEELTPLAEALEQAQHRVDQVTALREALEIKALDVAQLALLSKDDHTAASKAYSDGMDELEALEIVRQKLLSEIDELVKLKEAQKTSSELQERAADSVFGTIDLKETSSTTGAETLLANIAQSPADADQEIHQRNIELETVRDRLQRLQAQVESLMVEEREAAQSAAQAEEVANTAMKAAEQAVREEMEAAAVRKETKKALEQAMANLQDLGISFAEVDEQAVREREKLIEKNKKEAVKAVTQALESDDVKRALANVDNQLRFPTEATHAVAQAIPASVGVAPTVPDAAPPSTSTRTRLPTESFDEDGPRTTPKKKSKLVQRSLLVGAAAFAFVLFNQMMPGGVLSETAVGQAVQAVARKFANALAAVMLKTAALINKLPLPEVPHGEEGLIETLWLLLTSVIAVPLVCKLPGGSPVLGFLAGGAIIGPHALGIIQDVEGVRHLAELGVVFLLFNIGLELSLERLQSMQKFVFGMGSSQVVTTLAAVAYVCMAFSGAGGPAAVVLGGGLALSSTAVAMQVLQDRNETGSRHGRAAFAVLLLQDLAVVVLLMLIPLLAPAENGAANAGFSRIAKALGLAAVKAVTCIVGIILAGRTVLRPLYRRIADLDNPAIFSATTLLVVLGTSVITQLAGLSLALGAFLAGLLLAETEFVMQVESDIAPFKDLLMGLFFMTVGMEISIGIFVGQFRQVMGALALLIIGKTALMTAVGQAFGLSRIQAARAGLLLAAGGEFAFVAFGEALRHRILQPEILSFLFVVVALSMALTPFMAEFGQRLGKKFDRGDMKMLQPNEKETEELRDHVIIAGFGRVGQIIAQLLSEMFIPFVALDVKADRVQVGKDADLPVYFGDAGSSAILHSVGAAHARCAVITLDTPGANYRTVWALHKHYPNCKIYVRAHDVTHGITLEKAGATAVVPETLEPSLQLASAVLTQLNIGSDEVAQAITDFRKTHVSELQVLCRASGSSLGYGFRTEDEDDGPLPFDNGSTPAIMPIVEAIP